MRALLQRVTEASVVVDDEVVGSIRRGWLVLLGVSLEDDEAAADALADRAIGLRCFEDEHGKTNLAAAEVGAEFLVVSQFTLLADLSRGRRPSFIRAAPPDRARELVDSFTARIRQQGFTVAEGTFGAHMQVKLVNDGPFTIMLEK